MEVDAVKTVFEAEPPQEPSAPDVKQTVLVATLAGMLLCALVYTAKYMLDDTIRTEEDVRNYLGLSVLGIIPESEELRAMGNVPERRRAGGRQNRTR